jgi:hypothetical protein
MYFAFYMVFGYTAKETKIYDVPINVLKNCQN